jgi:hypothetical protein
VKLTFLSANLGDIDVEVADGIALEWLLGWLVAGDLGQAANPMTLRAPVQGRTGQMRDRLLERIQAVVQRQQRLLTKGNHRCLLQAFNCAKTCLPYLKQPALIVNIGGLRAQDHTTKSGNRPTGTFA